MSFMHSTFAVALTALLLTGACGLSRAAPVDGFEGGLPFGNDGDGVPLGFIVFAGAGSSASIGTTTTPPAPVPGAAAGNTVLEMAVNSSNFAGFVHNFENPAVDTWVPRDWTSFDALTFWLHGNNSGTAMFVDVLDNRNPGSTTDDAERWSSFFVDDFSGWKLMTFKFTDLARKEIGNGAPNDGLGLSAVHGWALGTLDTAGPMSWFVDDAQVVSNVPEPGTLALIVAGLAGFTASRRRRR